MAYNMYIMLLFFLSLFLFYPPVSALNKQPHLPDNARGELYEEKSRLGSRPPSCYNKCNNCHPCTAVQVPSIPSLHRVQPSWSSSVYDSASWDNNRYSNYKPLGWKCCCKDHLYNP